MICLWLQTYFRDSRGKLEGGDFFKKKKKINIYNKIFNTSTPISLYVFLLMFLVLDNFRIASVYLLFSKFD
jgi:hypothetical protein